MGDNRVAGAVSLHDTALVPISLFSDEKGRVRLTLGCVGNLLGQENRHQVATGTYVIHVFDILAEARAAQKVLATMHPTGWIKPDQIGISIELLPGGEGGLLFRSVGVSKPDIVFEGDGGPVSFTIHDHRRGASLRPPLALSTEFPRQDMLKHLETSGDLSVDQYSRAKALASLTSEVMTNTTCMNIYQREIEKIPGAMVALATVSTEQVIEELEDVLSEMCVSAEIPPNTFVHSKILRAVQQGSLQDPEDIVAGIVDLCVEECIRHKLD